MKTRKQHYVPQTYLKYFSIDKHNHLRVYVLNKNKKIFQANIEDIACERDFYEIYNPTTEAFKECNYIEDKFSIDYESNIPKVFNRLIAVSNLARNESAILYKSLKIEIARLLTVQLFRTKKALLYFDSTLNNYRFNLIRSLMPYKKYFSPKTIQLIDNIESDENFFKDAEFDELLSENLINLSIKILLNKNWCLYKIINYKDIQFITSDHPVVSYNCFNNSTELKDNGINRKGTIIKYPVSKDLQLTLYPKDLYFGNIDKYNNKIFFINDDEYVRNENILQYKQCLNQVYSSNINCLEKITK